MRKIAVWAALVVGCGSIGPPSPSAMARQGLTQGGAGRTVILEQAPKDHSIAIPREKLAQHLKDMDAKKLQTLRMIEGGKYNVNIRRITAAETGLVHPITADLWVVLEGGGTLTTGGVLEKGKILGGQSRPIKAGDVVYIPSGLPHGVSGVDNNITWLNVRWDTDWPPDSAMGAGTLNGLLGRAGGAPGRGPALPAGNQQALPYSYGGSGELFFSKEQLDQIMAGMRLKKSGNTRLIEGGRYNVNLRWNGTPSVEVHEQTIDTWYVLAGGATVNTGFQTKDGERVPNTGASVVTRPGDVFFHPSNFSHGFSQVSPDIFWLNIRWDDNYALSNAQPQAVAPQPSGGAVAPAQSTGGVAPAASTAPRPLPAPGQARGGYPPWTSTMANPYRVIPNWPRLGDIKPGAAIGIIPDGKGGTWLHHRSEPPILHIDASGAVDRRFGNGMFVQAHGFCQDRDGNFWAGDSGPFADNPATKGRGFQLFKFSPDGKVLLSLGKAGVSRAGTDTFIGPTACAIAPNGDIIVADGHWPRPTDAQQDGDRLVRLKPDGTFVVQYGRMGTAPGEFMGPHALAFDSEGRLFVADRSNNRVQVFDRNMQFVDEWRHFGRPSGIAILRDDTLIVADSESSQFIGGPPQAPEGGGSVVRNPGWGNGIRIGSAKDGSLRYYVQGTRPEGMGADNEGNVFAGLTGSCDASPSGGCLQKWVRK